LNISTEKSSVGPPHITILILALLPVITLTWSAFSAPCVEIGFFWTSVVTALSASFYAWCNSDRMGQSGMLQIYCMIACAITLAVTSVVDIANFSLLGKQHDAQTGLLLGTLVAFSTVALVAFRCRQQFPDSLSWGTLLVFLTVIGYGSPYIGLIEQEYADMIPVMALSVILATSILLCRYKANFSDSQHIAVFTTVALFIQFYTPSVKENHAAGLMVARLALLAGVLFFAKRTAAAQTASISSMVLLYFGVTDEVWSTTSILATLAFSVFVYTWYASKESFYQKQTLSVPFRQVIAVCTVIVSLSITAAWFTLSYDVLAENYSPVHRLVLLKNTPLWPGDATFVRMAMQDGSLWPDDVGDIPSNTLSLNDYLEAIRPTADQFSSIGDSKDHRSESLGSDGVGFGIKWIPDKGKMVLARVNSNSPAGINGLGRGDRVVTINGRHLSGIDSDAAWKKFAREWQPGAALSMNVVTSTGKKRTIAMKEAVNPQDPPQSGIITTLSGNKVGYLYLESFTVFQFEDMATHFEAFKNAGVHDLVLDLRYNSGGRMDKAVELANLIGGDAANGKLFIRWERSQRHEDDTSGEQIFECLPESIQTRRLVVLTTEDTCSASEAIINGLRPYLPVYTVGTTTCGKPFGISPVEFGDNILYPVTARLLNSRGEGHYSNGIRADFIVKDDLTHQLGDPQEGMLKKALEVLEKGENLP
jgi:carboxyl-terminal processing protease